MGREQRNMELMQTLDDAWNSQDLETFEQRHRPDVVVRWPGKPPTHGAKAHNQEALDFFRAFPDQHLDNRPYPGVLRLGGLDLLDRPLHRHDDYP